MSGDPRVLAPLQQAFKETEHYDVQRKILYAWVAETGQDNLAHVIESEIRAWTPPPAEPSLDERLDIYGRDITELAATANHHTLELAELKKRLDAIEEQPEPECTICGGTGHTRENCKPEPPAPDLDPVRVEAAAKAAWERVRGQSDREWEELPLATRNLWINDAESFIRAYLKDGGA